MIVRAVRSVVAPPRLNLAAIAATLRDVQRQFPSIERGLGARRDPLSDHVVDNMLAGYALVDAFVADGIELFAMGHLKHLLELNTTVLCGVSPERRAAHAAHVAATERRFYDERAAGIEDEMGWLGRHAADPVWTRAAGVYLRILGKPQLFIEGNHRTGALVMSYLLMREGRPPFVLSVDNAAVYFGRSAIMRDADKTRATTFLRRLVSRRRLAALLVAAADRRHLCA